MSVLVGELGVIVFEGVRGCVGRVRIDMLENISYFYQRRVLDFNYDIITHLQDIDYH